MASPATAHTRSQSHSLTRIEGGEVRISFSASAREVTRVAPPGTAVDDLAEALLAHIEPRIAVRAGGEACALEGARPLASQRGFARAELRFRCDRERARSHPIELSIEAFFEAAPSHVHFARIRTGDGPGTERLYTDRDRVHEIWTPGPDARGGDLSPGATLAAYVELGIEHILAGLDHIAFLATLLLLGGRIGRITWIVTGFTLGHSLTLSLAALGVVRPDATEVEAMIGFTIALVAAENVAVDSGSRRPIAAFGAGALVALAIASAVSGAGPPVAMLGGLALFTACHLLLADTREAALRLRPSLSVLFGLVHGFGFAGVLAEVGLPQARLVPALFGFNVGVEIGQLAIVVALALAARGVARARSGADWRPAADLASAVLCGLGVYWFIARAYAA